MVEAVVLGVDGATWDIINRLCKSNRLPNVESLLDGGTCGTLDSTCPPMTPLAWTSMATGVNPGKHGIYSFRKQDPDTYEVTPVEYSDIGRPPVWDALNYAGRTVGIVNFPVTAPAPDVDGFFISGFPAGADDAIVSSPDVREHLPDEYAVSPKMDPDKTPTAYFEEVKSLTELRGDVTVSLTDEYDPDVLWTVFMGVDWVQHYLWDDTINGERTVDRIYEAVDEQVGRVLDIVDDHTDVFLVSDHGFTELSGEIHMNSLIESIGELERNKLGLGTAAIQTGLSLLDLLPFSAKSATIQTAKRLLPDRIVKRGEIATENTGQQYIHERVNWDQTRAFSFGSMGRIFVNKESRYARGVVSESELESYRADLRNELLLLQHPYTNRTVFESVVPGEELYDGDRTDAAPDLVAEPTEWAFMSYGDFNDDWIHSPKGRVADHHPDGIFVSNRPGYQQAEADDININATDIAPTLLAAMSVALPEDLDGASHPAIVDSVPETVDLSEFEGARAQSRCNDRDTEDRLRDLGYV